MLVDQGKSVKKAHTFCVKVPTVSAPEHKVHLQQMMLYSRRNLLQIDSLHGHVRSTCAHIGMHAQAMH